ncbi:MAG: AAA domain-containing protein [Methanosarcinaceae archaeon]|nr:AAA domain-containing protein [Methanosarcinaceae archaeon]
MSLIPDLSVGGRQYLRDAAWVEEDSVNTLSDLESFLQNNQNADELLDNCGSLRNRGDRLRNTINALNTGDVVLHGGISLALPINENVSIFMTLQSDPISGQVYAAGFRRFKGKDIFGDTSHEVMHVAKSPEECLDIQFKFLNDLFNELKIVHDYNQNKEWREQKSLQAYVFDTYEQILFNKLLNESVKDPKLAFVSLKLMFHFHNTGLSEMELHPSDRISYPLVVLTQEINMIAGLPIPFVTRLPEVLKAFPAPDFDYELKPSDLFWFEHSNTLKYDAIAMAWSGNKPEAVEWVGSELSRRLVASSSVLSGIRAKARHLLVNWPPKFKFYDSTDFKYPELSKLDFITQYESFTSALAIRKKRSMSWKERVREGISIPLEYIGMDIWKLVNPIDSSLFEQNETFLSILAPLGKEGEKAQIAFDDYQFRGTFAPTTKKDISFARVYDKKIDPKDGKVKLLYMEIEYGDKEEPFKTEDIAIIHPRYTDFTSRHVLGRLKEINKQDENDFIQLLRNPNRFTRRINENETVRANAMVYAQNASFTDSQKHAFEHIINNRLTLIWGPPGTGKTHLLAKSVLCFVKAKRDQGIQVRIGVTAFTHAAVENILIKIQEFSNEENLEHDLQIYKIGETRTEVGYEKLKSINEYKIEELEEQPYLVMGSTVYGFNKIKRNIGLFDILIVDEASQMKFGELAVGMSILGCGNRLVLAGDDLQLPPIISGDYPDPEDGLPGLHESIFTYLRHRDDEVQPKYTCQLLENWRMNDTLTRFPAETLYGDEFKPATPGIGSHRLNLLFENTNIGSSDTEKQFVEWVLDPNSPLVVCILENVQASVENIIEAELVAKLTIQIRERLPQKTTEILYPDDENGDSNFWRHGLFIVSPHHAQISAIKDKLSILKKWKYPTFVDTVDKMQGQESEVVIVSYGVSDTETAMNEAEFIYSLNRLNVSVTRAKSKCIVFLPRPLLEAHMDILQNEKAAKGLNHMLSLVDFCRNNGDQQSFELDFLQPNAGAILTCMRAT